MNLLNKHVEESSNVLDLVSGCDFFNLTNRQYLFLLRNHITDIEHTIDGDVFFNHKNEREFLLYGKKIQKIKWNRL